MKHKFRKYDLFWMLPLLLLVLIAILLIDFSDMGDGGEAPGDEVTMKADSSDSDSPRLRIYDPERSPSDPGDSEYDRGVPTELNFKGPFTLLHPKIQSVLTPDGSKPAGGEKSPEDEAGDEDPVTGPSITPPSNEPRFTMRDLREISRLRESALTTGRRNASRRAAMIEQMASTGGGSGPVRFVTEPDYDEAGVNNAYVQYKEASGLNNQRVTQIGNYNYAEQLLLNTIVSDAIIRSVGNQNTAVQDLVNAYNARAVILQDGSFNEAYQEIYSRNTDGSLVRTSNEIRQRGFYNYFRSYQAGLGNSIDAFQRGGNNSIRIEQLGNNNSVKVSQKGSGNSVDITQN